MIDGAIRSCTNSLASALFRSGTGTIGQINASYSSGTTFTLANPADIVQFEVNMYLVASSTDGGTPVGAPSVGIVTAVDRVAGTFTIGAGAPASWAANLFLSVQGDLNAKIKGLAAWLPSTSPTVGGGDNFFGVDRSADATRLAGVNYNGSSQSIEEALIDSSALLAREGGKPDVAITTFASYSALEKSLGSKVQYVDMKGPAGIAFRGIMVNGANSMIKVFPDRNQLSQVCHLLQMDTWQLASLGDAPQILRYGDGLEMLRVSNQDAGELRVGYYAQLATNAPGWNATVSLSA